MKIMTGWMEEGIQQGKQEGTLSLVLRLLRRRIGPIEPGIEEQIRKLSLEQLENLGEVLLDFSTVSDLVAWLQAQQERSQTNLSGAGGTDRDL